MEAVLITVVVKSTAHACLAAADRLNAVSTSKRKAAELSEELRWLATQLPEAQLAGGQAHRTALEEVTQTALAAERFAAVYARRTRLQRFWHAVADRNMFTQLMNRLDKWKSRLHFGMTIVSVQPPDVRMRDAHVEDLEADLCEFQSCDDDSLGHVAEDVQELAEEAAVEAACGDGAPCSIQASSSFLELDPLPDVPDMLKVAAVALSTMLHREAHGGVEHQAHVREAREVRSREDVVASIAKTLREERSRTLPPSAAPAGARGARLPFSPPPAQYHTAPEAIDLAQLEGVPAPEALARASSEPLAQTLDAPHAHCSSGAAAGPGGAGSEQRTPARPLPRQLEHPETGATRKEAWTPPCSPPEPGEGPASQTLEAAAAAGAVAGAVAAAAGAAQAPSPSPAAANAALTSQGTATERVLASLRALAAWIVSDAFSAPAAGAALDEVITAMTSHESDPRVQQAACETVAQACDPNHLAGCSAVTRLACRQAATRAGFVQHATLGMAMHAGEADLQRAACLAVRAVVASDDQAGRARKRGAVDSGFLQCASGAMAAHLAHAGVQEAACLAVREICIGTDAAGLLRLQVAVAVGLLQRAVHAMAMHAGVVSVQVAACQAVRNVCAGKGAAHLERAQAAVDAGFLPRLASAMGTHEASVHVQEAACWALCNVCVGTNAAALRRLQGAAHCGLITHVVGAMARHGSEAAVQQAACKALCNMCAGSDEGQTHRAQAAVEAGFLLHAAEAMVSHSGDADVVLEALHALFNVCTGTEETAAQRRQAAADAGLLQLALNAMSAHGAQPGMESAGKRVSQLLLHRICDADLCVDLIISCGNDDATAEDRASKDKTQLVAPTVVRPSPSRTLESENRDQNAEGAAPGSAADAHA